MTREQLSWLFVEKSSIRLSAQLHSFCSDSNVKSREYVWSSCKQRFINLKRACSNLKHLYENNVNGKRKEKKSTVSRIIRRSVLNIKKPKTESDRPWVYCAAGAGLDRGSSWSPWGHISRTGGCAAIALSPTSPEHHKVLSSSSLYSSCDSPSAHTHTNTPTQMYAHTNVSRKSSGGLR